MLEKLKEILDRGLVDYVAMDFDSLALMMLSMEIEDAFDFKFTELVRFETVGDVCGYLESRI